MVQQNRGHSGGQKTRPPHESTRQIFMSGLAAGAIVTTLDGDLPVEFLHAGDRLVTRDAGMVRLRAVTARQVARNDLLRITPRALAPTSDAADFWMAAQQPLLLTDWRARIIYGRTRVLLPASRLIDGEHIRRETGGGVTTLFQLHFEQKHFLRVGGIDVTSTPFKGLKRRKRAVQAAQTSR